MTGKAPKRFYKKVDVEALADGFAITLDGRPVRTPMKSKLQLPSHRLANAVAEEWDAQTETLDLASMALTGFANTALDRVRPRHKEVVDEIAGYAETDLLCYRAADPPDLVERQEREWQPHLDWLARTHGAQLVPTAGIVHVKQDAEALATIRHVIGVRDDFTLTGLHVLTTGTGSFVLGLAVVDGALEASAAVSAGLLDEIYQAELWGEDTLFTERREGLARELLAAERFIGLLLPQA
ncbi:MAG: ATPase [Alphaproteobacteria bacterium]|nr:ATPase [Alphaproteobacteria bacterium]